jgi:class 3 adenylate cyclase
VPTRTLTVVFTDLADYTASVGRADREAIREIIAAHEERVAPVISARGGRIVKNLGDSYMALFEAATDAAQACLELVNAAVREDGITIRAAMATGDVETIDGDAFGEAANLAARILAKTPAGEVWMASTSRMCMNQTELAWEGVGRFSLKGIAGEVPVYRLVPEGRAWIPQSLVHAARKKNLVRVVCGGAVPPMPPDPMILLEGFQAGSDELRSVIDRLPVVSPAQLWLQAYSIAPSDRYAWTDLGRGLLIGTQAAVTEAIRAVHRPVPTSVGTDTIIFEMSTIAVIDLVMAGLALPAVPISEVVAGYTYDLLGDGRWTNMAAQSLLRIEVNATGLQVEARSQGVVVGGQRLQLGDKHHMEDGELIETPSGGHVFRQVNQGGYLGLLIADTAARLGVGDGQTIEVGREPQHPGFALPDRRGQDNLRWCVGGRAARAREGGFTLDRALAGRRQAAVQIQVGAPNLIGLHKTCPTFLLQPHGLTRVEAPAQMEIDDMIVVGTSVISVRRPQG